MDIEDAPDILVPTIEYNFSTRRYEIVEKRRSEYNSDTEFSYDLLEVSCKAMNELLDIQSKVRSMAGKHVTDLLKNGECVTNVGKAWGFTFNHKNPYLITLNVPITLDMS